MCMYAVWKMALILSLSSVQVIKLLLQPLVSSGLRCEFDRIALLTFAVPYEDVFRMLLLVTFRYLAAAGLSQLFLKHVVRVFLVVG